MLGPKTPRVAEKGFNSWRAIHKPPPRQPLPRPHVTPGLARACGRRQKWTRKEGAPGEEMRGRRGADRPHPAGPSTVRAGGTSGRQASALHTDPETAKPGKSLLAADPFQVSRAAGCTRPELCLSRLSLLPCHPPASPHPTHHSAGLRCPGAYSAGCPAQRPSQGTGGHRGRSLPPPLPRLSLWRPPGPDPTRPTSSMESRSQDRALVTAPFTAPGSGPPLPTRGQSALGMRAPSPGRPPLGPLS